VELVQIFHGRCCCGSGLSGKLVEAICMQELQLEISDINKQQFVHMTPASRLEKCEKASPKDRRKCGESGKGAERNIWPKLLQLV